ncbi:phage holin family protein [Stieleria sp. ICT_E10.1]|uniref:phage holin family protein n=1 Tax=Stieleria sedimenti TaxID=2976331 RepID=UPI00217FACC7|nr:phage holin family protein [Stieleria sedimenti]MCS7465497.1 phage holin family protein [Stieleria sedimenti]
MHRNSSFQKVIRDLIDLWELQWQLFSVDAQAAKRSLGRAIACTLVALLLVGSGFTVFLFGLGFLLEERTRLSTGTALSAVGAATLGVVGVLLLIARSGAKSAAAAMEESKSEFNENLRWLKATLVAPDSSPRNQIRRESFSNDGRRERYYTTDTVSPLSRR